MKKTLVTKVILAAWAFAMAPEAAQARSGYHHHHRYHGYAIARHFVVAPVGYHFFRGARALPFGRIEIEIEPKDAQVFVDGNFVGTASKLDGWPNFLWLRQGTYQITLVHPEHKTITHNIAVFPGQRMTLETPMEKGESTPPPKSKKADPAPEVETAKEPD